ncbi:hypothetical protein C2S51_032465 [Perilla frutescens var. frutescens]|nr:hypothetical protein C2S51_032465 [Perilla frutescens var. frutescens]
MDHVYEKLGGIGGVYRSKCPESTHDLRLYSTNEFPLRDHAAHSGLRNYLVFPVFDYQTNECYGVLELLSDSTPINVLLLSSLDQGLQIAGLRSTHINFIPISPRFDMMTRCNRAAFTEVEKTFLLIAKIPQLHMANFWIPYGKNDSINSHPRCMELAYCTKGIKDEWDCMPTYQVRFIHVQHRKGIIPMVLKSESKSCFCRNLSDFSIGDQPLAHYERQERRNICFAICLQSSCTGYLVYAVEFFLNDGPSTFLNFLLPIMKQELKTFKIASGKHLREELQKEHQHIHEEQVQSVSYATQTEKCHDDASDLKKTETGKRKIGLHLSLEVLKPHFGKKLKDVAQDLGGEPKHF